MRPPTLFKKEPKKHFQLPFGNTFFTIVIVVSYLLTRMTYEKNNKFGNKIVSFVNEKTGMKFQIPSDLKMFKMNAHYKRADKKISDIVFLCLLSFFVFKMKWNNIEDTSGINKIAWGSSVVIAPILINAFFENKDKLKIDPDSVSNSEEFKKSNNQTKAFLSIALLLTFVVGLKLAHRIFVCKGGMIKPMIIQMIIIGTTVGLHFLANKDKKENFGSSTEEKMNKSWVIAFLLILSFTVCKKDTIDYIIEGSLWGYLIQNIARWDYISPDLM